MNPGDILFIGYYAKTARYGYVIDWYNASLWCRHGGLIINENYRYAWLGRIFSFITMIFMHFLKRMIVKKNYNSLKNLKQIYNIFIK